MKNEKNILLAGWAAVIVFAAFRVLMGVISDGPVARIAPFVSTFLIFGFALFHGIKRYGFKDTLIFFMITFLIGWLYENISVISGFPFGHYYYTQVLGPKLWHVPLYIMFAYFATGYLAWTMGHILLDKFDNHIRRAEIFLIPFIAAFVMTLWDICTDPYCSTINKFWIWTDGGAYFGVPLVNFLGWYLCVYTIYGLFAFYLARKSRVVTAAISESRTFWVLPVLMYTAITLQFPFIAIFAESRQVVSCDGHVWWTSDIYWSMVTISIYTMIFVSLLCLVKLARSQKWQSKQ